MALSQVQRVIAALLAMLGQRVHRTKLVKLVYLADVRFYQLNGQTLTGLSYMWDNFGPNAISNAIVKEADLLVASGKVIMVARPSMYGGDSYLYSVPEATKNDALAELGPGERQVLRDVVKEFGPLTVQALVAVSKKTESFQKAKQYEPLEFHQDKPVAELRRRIMSDAAFLQSGRRGLDDLKHGRLISQEELDRLYAEKG